VTRDELKQRVHESIKRHAEAIVAALDALAVTGHPDAGPATGAVHACSHNAQIAGLVGAAIGLLTSKAMEHLAGRVALGAIQTLAPAHAARIFRDDNREQECHTPPSP